MKKLIIVTGMIMLASCATVKHATLPEEGRSARSVRTYAVTETAEDQDHLILATLWYQKSAEMRALYYQCFRNAETALAENLARAGRAGAVPGTALSDIQTLSDQTRPAAVVIDIDETLLDNSPFQGWQVFEKKEYNDKDWLRWVELARAEPLPGAVAFTRYADSLGVEVFYVSNRTVREMGPTIRNMAALGFANSDSTHMILKESTSSKVARRAMIERDYEIILLIGDNLADLSGLYEKRGADNGFGAVDTDRKLFGTRYIVLPNPMYGNWLSELLKKTEGQTEKEKLLKLLESF